MTKRSDQKQRVIGWFGLHFQGTSRHRGKSRQTQKGSKPCLLLTLEPTHWLGLSSLSSSAQVYLPGDGVTHQWVDPSTPTISQDNLTDVASGQYIWVTLQLTLPCMSLGYVES